MRIALQLDRHGFSAGPVLQPLKTRNPVVKNRVIASGVPPPAATSMPRVETPSGCASPCDAGHCPATRGRCCP